MPPKLTSFACFLAPIIQSASGKTLWSTSPADARDIYRTTYPLGNGRLGAMPVGPPAAETLTLNLDSLWSGGPFNISNYTGGNPHTLIASALPGIRDWIFTNGTGNVSALLGSNDNYGSYQVLGNLTVKIPSLSSDIVSNYTRKLDMSTGTHTTTFIANGNDLETTGFCSFPDQVCVYTVQSTGAGDVPPLEVTLDNVLVSPQLQNVTCVEGDTTKPAHLRLRGVTQLGPPEGMRYDSIARVVSNSNTDVSCDENTGLLSIAPRSGTKSVSIVIGAGTNYDAKKGTAEHNYSFRGEDPALIVEATTLKAATKTLDQLRGRHIDDFTALTGLFELSLPDPLNSSQTQTSELINRYTVNNTSGDPYLESLLMENSRYLFISSSRPGSLPPNLQGRWSEGLETDWSADYHANINFQMNHWTSDQTGLTDLQSPLWDYMTDTWMPRGAETATLLYNAPGWVVHNEMNIFGHTAMKSAAEWANYPIAAAWMMQHVFDHWDYSRNATWLLKQGYPLLKGVAMFWLDQLQQDGYYKDGSLVVNPCNSPEHGGTTFGCAHYQQLIHQVFHSILAVQPTVADPDTVFLTNLTSSLHRLDKGFHTGSFSQIKEWKIPDSYTYDRPNDTHRHLSELVGWHPGFSLSALQHGYSNATIASAVRQKLISRGPGKGPDGNSAWAKVWRSACWARLNDTEHAHWELRFAIETNWAPNGLSMYFGDKIPFQIDGNFGFGGAVLGMLVVDLPGAEVGRDGEAERTVVLGPAIPGSWGGGRVKGLVVRGGGVVDFGWDGRGVVGWVSVKGRDGGEMKGVRFVNKEGRVLVDSV
ncbi:hypothetical protein PtrSN002B_009456 [Pyrenophora tritici-repentis]|uniref:Glycoside hydrolase family 95 protein n=2 Tax=Pyrenophora tritici-repentis TaxID=45151 RepID=A0A317AVN7_9PLEO|nr:alpha-fucosidase [Pyrenophora tritici-repentis Pt-1C-BFP]KAA8620745.1 Glycoside hydrolase family 95 protein [Pyrenophora tritici-repentis]EDU43196.1 alpha-fucosidase [Pyrenophora tritici-repentis Pt-1C-BFP]KAF7449991.1 Glycoside hydrolase family 95 protein [Pyrenophora tritici-repentis]KAI0572325.1 Glycoside hydrolase family 95 protein [Pyrenophora tritici-repentis]KAI0574271.1 Glycoside hydrolase family 95 protein [Pyrenophora tritici-repentis]